MSYLFSINFCKRVIYCFLFISIPSFAQTQKDDLKKIISELYAKEVLTESGRRYFIESIDKNNFSLFSECLESVPKYSNIGIIKYSGLSVIEAT